MIAEALATHMERPLGRGHVPQNAFTGAAGGAACGDLIRISLTIEEGSPDGLITDAGFDASGCGAAGAAGSAVVALCRKTGLLSAARIGADEISAELGGLSDAKRHGAELAADALHRALGAAARARARLAPHQDRVLVAMSGGVDSAVVALLAAEAGKEAVGVTLELWSDPENDGEQSCCSAQAVRGARQIAHAMGMAHLSVDMRAEFRAGVVNPWLAGHLAGLTPNPCVRCNGSVRLDGMLELAQRLGAQTLHTGHYARVHDEHGTPLLRVALDPVKDQSYVLSALKRESLSRLRFPLGEMTKPQVRALAQQAGLSVASRPDSQDLCFLAGTEQKAFLTAHGGSAPTPGPVIDRDGNMLGEHAGHQAYTVGQRRGLALREKGPLFVLKTDARTNTVTVGTRAQLLSDTIKVERLELHRPGGEVDAVKIRSRGRRLACRLDGQLESGGHERALVRLSEPLERTAPGQLACLYAGELIVGHGTISE
ncbi:MAG TPA: tRNA 2-thiouridine(34) synthase MnmA [Solirubrobacteraceae bacterium]